LDEERVFGRQRVDCIELLSMQGLEAVDERGRGGYPVYGRLFLDPSRYVHSLPELSPVTHMVWRGCARRHHHHDRGRGQLTS
jgi:hypothetical protein